ncbi:hypothetical protein ACH413_12220 [Lentzea sp. NPDC020367]|uniref:hypothetical protein n=1 Tax=Lentzea sp. NPDC020367 TaxID=3364125 RepID=UPI0037990794
MKSWNIPRNCHRKRDGVSHATRSTAQLCNLTMTAERPPTADDAVITPDDSAITPASQHS